MDKFSNWLEAHRPDDLAIRIAAVWRQSQGDDPSPYILGRDLAALLGIDIKELHAMNRQLGGEYRWGWTDYLEMRSW
jgi:hypothetical protein